MERCESAETTRSTTGAAAGLLDVPFDVLVLICVYADPLEGTYFSHRAHQLRSTPSQRHHLYHMEGTTPAMQTTLSSVCRLLHDAVEEAQAVAQRCFQTWREGAMFPVWEKIHARDGDESSASDRQGHQKEDLESWCRFLLLADSVPGFSSTRSTLLARLAHFDIISREELVSGVPESCAIPYCRPCGFSGNGGCCNVVEHFSLFLLHLRDQNGKASYPHKLHEVFYQSRGLEITSTLVALLTSWCRPNVDPHKKSCVHLDGGRKRHSNFSPPLSYGGPCLEDLYQRASTGSSSTGRMPERGSALTEKDQLQKVSSTGSDHAVDGALVSDTLLLLLDSFVGSRQGKDPFILRSLFVQWAECYSAAPQYNDVVSFHRPLQTARDTIRLLLAGDRRGFWGALQNDMMSPSSSTYTNLFFSLLMLPSSVVEYVARHPDLCPTSSELAGAFPLCPLVLPPGWTAAGVLPRGQSSSRPNSSQHCNNHRLSDGLFASARTRKVVKHFLMVVGGIAADIKLDEGQSHHLDERIVDPSTGEELVAPRSFALHLFCFFVRRYTADLIRRGERQMLELLLDLICRIPTANLSSDEDSTVEGDYYHRIRKTRNKAMLEPVKPLLRMILTSLPLILTKEGNLMAFAAKWSRSHNIVALLVERAVCLYRQAGHIGGDFVQGQWRHFFHTAYRHLIAPSVGLLSSPVRARTMGNALRYLELEKRQCVEFLLQLSQTRTIPKPQGPAIQPISFFESLFRKSAADSSPFSSVLSYLPLLSICALALVNCGVYDSLTYESKARHSLRSSTLTGNERKHSALGNNDFLRYCDAVMWGYIQKVTSTDTLLFNGTGGSQRDDTLMHIPLVPGPYREAPRPSSTEEETANAYEKLRASWFASVRPNFLLDPRYLFEAPALRDSMKTNDDEGTATSAMSFSSAGSLSHQGGIGGPGPSSLAPAQFLARYSSTLRHSEDCVVGVRALNFQCTFLFCLPATTTKEPEEDALFPPPPIFRLGRFLFGPFLQPSVCQWTFPNDFKHLHSLVLVLPPSVDSLPDECLQLCCPALQVSIVGRVHTIGNAIFPDSRRAMPFVFLFDKLVGVRRVRDMFLTGSHVKWMTLPPFEPGTVVGHAFMAQLSLSQDDHRPGYGYSSSYKRHYSTPEVETAYYNIPIDFSPLQNVTSVGHEAFARVSPHWVANGMLRELKGLRNIGANFFLGSALSSLSGSLFDSKSLAICPQPFESIQLEGLFACTELSACRKPDGNLDTHSPKEEKVNGTRQHGNNGHSTPSNEVVPFDVKSFGEVLARRLPNSRRRSEHFVPFAGCRSVQAVDLNVYLALWKAGCWHECGLALPPYFCCGLGIQEIDFAPFVGVPIQRVGKAMLASCLELVTVLNLSVLGPAVEIQGGIPDYFLASCVRLEHVALDGLNRAKRIGNHFLAGCVSLKGVDLSSFTAVEAVGSFFLQSCMSLKQCDLTGFRTSLQQIGQNFLQEARLGIPGGLDLSPLCLLKHVPSSFLYEAVLAPPVVNLDGMSSVESIGSSFLSLSNVSVVDLSTWHNLRRIGSSFLMRTLFLRKVIFSPHGRIRRIGDYFLSEVNHRSEWAWVEEFQRDACANPRLTTFDFDWAGLRSVKAIPHEFMSGSAPFTVELWQMDEVTKIGDGFMAFFPSGLDRKAQLVGRAIDEISLDVRVIDHRHQDQVQRGNESWRMDLAACLPALQKVTTIGESFLCCRPLVETDQLIDFSPLKHLTAIDDWFLVNANIRRADFSELVSLRRIGSRFLAFCSQLVECRGLAALVEQQRAEGDGFSIGSDCLLECVSFPTEGPLAQEMASLQPLAGSSFLATNGLTTPFLSNYPQGNGCRFMIMSVFPMTRIRLPVFSFGFEPRATGYTNYFIYTVSSPPRKCCYDRSASTSYLNEINAHHQPDAIEQPENTGTAQQTNGTSASTSTKGSGEDISSSCDDDASKEETVMWKDTVRRLSAGETVPFFHLMGTMELNAGAFVSIETTTRQPAEGSPLSSEPKDDQLFEEEEDIIFRMGALPPVDSTQYAEAFQRIERVRRTSSFW